SCPLACGLATCFMKQVAKPQAKGQEVLVKVMTTAATTADTMLRTGKPYFGRLFTGLRRPKKPIPGTGFAGVVEQVGPDVSAFQPGDRVFGETLFGFSANAEYLTVAEQGVILPMPDNLNFAEAASFCDGHLTSYNFLKRLARIQPGQRVLINGAAGALGTSAVQLAHYYGAHVTAVCSGHNAGLVQALGADVVIDYHNRDFTQGPEQYDIIYDAVGKSTFRACKKVLKEGGKYLTPVLKLPLLWQMLVHARASKQPKFEATGTNSADTLRTLLAEVVEIFQAGGLKTVIDRQFALENLAEAHRYIDGGHKKGNVVIVNV
ncbi:MAG: NAD(P)-dependent alcohol dehydrogenase, partial [Bacteroidota bacterium]